MAHKAKKVNALPMPPSSVISKQLFSSLCLRLFLLQDWAAAHLSCGCTVLTVAMGGLECTEVNVTECGVIASCPGLQALLFGVPSQTLLCRAICQLSLITTTENEVWQSLEI